MRLVDHPSPNHGPRADGVSVSILLVHYTGMKTGQAALDRLCDPAAQVSTHYVIDEDGTVYRLVDENRRAWHAGKGTWQGQDDINSRSVGIELVNPGHRYGYRPFPQIQVEAFRTLGREVMARHGIPPAGVLGHSDIAPLRKEDPGELFPWEALSREGIGIWPDPDFRPGSSGPVTPAQACAWLRQVGYSVDETILEPVLKAFRRHYHPEGLAAEAAAETLRRLQALAAGKFL
ncbi:MAG: N-acetylmuramoyl-L-alanine amidase [Pseudomonadota bacterium]|nr:N-acetylmuramoyl-L-alanine amidase [Pseudomonadota bacterium]